MTVIYFMDISRVATQQMSVKVDDSKLYVIVGLGGGLRSTDLWVLSYV